METSQSITNIAKALIAFQSECPAISKDTQAYNYKYAPLEVIQDTIKNSLHKNNLTYTQMPKGEFGLVTYLIHASGEFFRSEYEMKPKKEFNKVKGEIVGEGFDTPQTQGSRITYQKRYALCAILGLIIGGEDDDGASASKVDNKKPKYKNGTVDPSSVDTNSDAF